MNNSGLINNIDSTITYKTICQKLKSPLDTNILRIKPHIKRNNAQLLEYASKNFSLKSSSLYSKLVVLDILLKNL